MGNNYFTQEQVNILKANPYVKNVSEKAITYTEAFCEEFYIHYQEDPLPSKILKELDFDPKILGESRVYNISKRVRK